MRVAFFLNTPGQVHLFKNPIAELKRRGHSVVIIARRFGDTTTLLDELGHSYHVYANGEKPILRKILGHLLGILAVLKHLGQFNPDLVVGAGVDSALAARLVRKPSVVFTDYESVPVQLLFVRILCDAIITPSCFIRNVGPRQIRVNAYKELAYLHPDVFAPRGNILNDLGVDPNEPYVVVRFNGLYALHDVGMPGFSMNEKRMLLSELTRFSRVFVSSEETLPDDMRQYVLPTPKSRIHDVVSYASLVIADTNTIVAEAAVLGTPAVRYSTIVDRGGMSVLIELERKYGLIAAHTNPKHAISEAVAMLNTPNLKVSWMEKRARMLSGKVNLTDYLVQFIENYPSSRAESKNEQMR